LPRIDYLINKILMTERLQMPTLSTTKMSSRGQVVIPEEVRVRLGLTPGVQFVVVGDDDVVILKRISAPSMDEFDGLLRDARRQARSVGLRKADIEQAITEARTTP
jgi:AbrB family looped-hinge helix DNA binding protein